MTNFSIKTRQPEIQTGAQTLDATELLRLKNQTREILNSNEPEKKSVACNNIHNKISTLRKLQRADQTRILRFVLRFVPLVSLPAIHDDRIPTK